MVPFPSKKVIVFHFNPSEERSILKPALFNSVAVDQASWMVLSIFSAANEVNSTGITT